MNDDSNEEDPPLQGVSTEEKCKKIFENVIEMECLKNGKIPEKIRSFVIIQACDELENIAEIDETTIKSLEKEKAQSSELGKKIFSMLECIEVINPREGRINIVEMAKSGITTEESE
jgi:hypothetical protein